MENLKQLVAINEIARSKTLYPEIIKAEYQENRYPFQTLKTGEAAVLYGFNWSEEPITEVREEVFFVTDHDYLYASPWLTGKAAPKLYRILFTVLNPLVVEIEPPQRPEYLHDQLLLQALSEQRDSILIRPLPWADKDDTATEFLLLRPRTQIHSIECIQGRHRYLMPYTPPHTYEPGIECHREHWELPQYVTEDDVGAAQVIFRGY